jgi:predicted GNAT family N-acyltransferase
MSRIVKFYFKDTELHQQAMAIRTKVFVDEQQVPADLEYENEEESTHFMVEYRKQWVGTARYRRTDKGIKFERFAMLQSFRSKGLGHDILRFMLTDVSPFKQKIYLHAQVGAINFYKRHGFVIVGPLFTEAGIEHYPMEYEEPDKLQQALEKAICRR